MCCMCACICIRIDVLEARKRSQVAGSIRNQQSLCAWLSGTFLAVRACRDPHRYAAACTLPLHYQVGGHPLTLPQGPDVAAFLRLLGHVEEEKMRSVGLISESSEESGDFQATALGRTLCRSGVSVATLHQLRAAGAPRDLKARHLLADWFGIQISGVNTASHTHKAGKLGLKMFAICVWVCTAVCGGFGIIEVLGFAATCKKPGCCEAVYVKSSGNIWQQRYGTPA